MDREQLDKDLNKLLDKLDECSGDDAEVRQSVKRLRQDIQDVMDGEGKISGHHRDGLIDRLEDSARRFEATHPSLSLVIENIMNTINNLGI